MKSSPMILLALMLLVGVAHAATYTVAPDGSGDFPTIQDAIYAIAWDGDTIELMPGTYTGPGNRDVENLGKSLTIRSQGGDPASVTIDCQGSAGEPHRFLHVQGHNFEFLIEGLTITGGHTGSSRIPGGGALLIVSGSTAHIERCVFEDNHTAMSWDNAGGAVYIDNGCNPTFTDCEFRQNSGFFGGAVAVNHSSNATFTGCSFIENTGGRGGAIWGNCTTKISCLLVANTAEQGGAIWGNGYNPDVSISCTYALNAAPTGGAIYAQTGYGSPVQLTSTIVAYSSQGVGVWAETGVPLQITCTDIFGNMDGDWVGTLADLVDTDGNFAMDPCFCDLDGHDLQVCADSVCLPEFSPGGCAEQVGALGAGCPACGCGGIIAVESRSWSSVKGIFDQ